MNDKQKEEAISLKIKLLREKNQKLEERRKLVEEDKKNAEARGSAVSSKMQSTKASRPYKDHDSSRRAHMDHPVDDHSDQRHGYSPKPRDDIRNAPGGFRGYNEDGEEDFGHRDQGSGDYKRGPRRGQGDRRGRGGYSSYRNDDRQDDYEGGGRGSREPARGQRGSRRPQQDRYNNSNQYDRKFAEREAQRRSNIEKMEAQMSGKLQKGDDDWQDPGGYLQDPRREGEGEYDKRPPPRNLRYNPNDGRRHQQNRQYGGPQTRDRTIEMTGRERLEHDRWKKQQDEADKYRLAKSQAKDGHWKRDWDSDKRNVDEMEDDSRQTHDHGYQRGGGGRRGSNRREDNFDRRQNTSKFSNNNEFDNRQRRQETHSKHNPAGSRSNRSDAANVEEDWGNTSAGKEEWPSLQGEKSPSHDSSFEKKHSKSSRRDDNRRHGSPSGESSSKQDEKRRPRDGDHHKHQEPSTPQNLTNNPLTSPEDQFQNAGVQFRKRGKGRDRGRTRTQDGRSGQRDRAEPRSNRERAQGKSPRQNANLKVDIPSKEQKPKTTVGRKDSSDSNPSVNRTSSLTSPLKTPENFVPVGDWAEEVESHCPVIKEGAEEKESTDDAFKTDDAGVTTTDNADDKTNDVPAASFNDNIANAADNVQDDTAVVSEQEVGAATNDTVADDDSATAVQEGVSTEADSIPQKSVAEISEETCATADDTAIVGENEAATVQGKIAPIEEAVSGDSGKMERESVLSENDSTNDTEKRSADDTVSSSNDVVTSTVDIASTEVGEELSSIDPNLSTNESSLTNNEAECVSSSDGASPVAVDVVSSSQDTVACAANVSSTKIVENEVESSSKPVASVGVANASESSSEPVASMGLANASTTDDSFTENYITSSSDIIEQQVVSHDKPSPPSDEAVSLRNHGDASSADEEPPEDDADDDSFVTVGSDEENLVSSEEKEDEFKDAGDVHKDITDGIDEVVDLLIKNIIENLAEEVVSTDNDEIDQTEDPNEKDQLEVLHAPDEQTHSTETEDAVVNIEQGVENAEEALPTLPTLIPASVSQEEIFSSLGETTFIIRQNEL